MLVRGPDGELYETHVGHTGKNPAITVPCERCWRWGFAFWKGRVVSPTMIPHIPGTSIPDDTMIYRSDSSLRIGFV